MEKIKVLMIGNHQSVKGGITSVIQQLLAYDWESVGVEMNFLPTYIETSSIKKIAYYTRAYRNIKRTMRFNKPVVVHIHMSYKGSFYRKYLIHKLCKKYDIPDIIHLHGSEFQKWYSESNARVKKKIKNLLAESSSFIVLGEKWNRAIKEIEPSTKTIVVSNTVPIPKETVSWKNNPFQILFLGVLIKRKGVADLIQAIALLKKADKLSNIRFIIAGSGSEEESLKHLANELQVESWIEFTGWTDGKSKEKYIKESQALILPSYNEGLPIAVLEAISYGLPVISTDVGDMSAAIKNERNGFLIKPGDVSELANSILKISSDEEKYTQMVKNSKKIAIEEFSDDNYLEKLLRCYHELTQNK